jgi:TetR/AcrR family transcriptional repressor of nem operon
MPRSEIPATRDRLVNAAAHLIWHRSYTATGVDELCRLAGARKGSFYHFFRTKSDLAVAAIESQWAAIRRDVFDAAATTGAPGLERFRRLIERMDDQQRRAFADRNTYVGSPFGNLGQELAHQDERIRLVVQTVFDAQCHYFASWLDEAVRARQIPAGDNELRARQLLALLEGALLLTKVAQDAEVFAPLCAAIDALTRGSSAPAPARPTAMPELL